MACSGLEKHEFQGKGQKCMKFFLVIAVSNSFLTVPTSHLFLSSFFLSPLLFSPAATQFCRRHLFLMLII
jgi:hypothetical protein